MVSQRAFETAAASVLGQNHGGIRTCTKLATVSLVNFAASQVQNAKGNGTSRLWRT